MPDPVDPGFFDDLYSLVTEPEGEASTLARQRNRERLSQIGHHPLDTALGAADGITSGWGDEIMGALASAGRGYQAQVPDLSGEYGRGHLNPEETFEAGQGVVRQAMHDAEEEAPAAFGTGQLAGSIAGAALAPEGRGATAAQRLIRGAGEGAAFGGAWESGHATEDRLAHGAEGSLTGALGGTVVAGTGELGRAGLRAGRDAVTRRVADRARVAAGMGERALSTGSDIDILHAVPTPTYGQGSVQRAADLSRRMGLSGRQSGPPLLHGERGLSAGSTPADVAEHATSLERRLRGSEGTDLVIDEAVSGSPTMSAQEVADLFRRISPEAGGTTAAEVTPRVLFPEGGDTRDVLAALRALYLRSGVEGSEDMLRRQAGSISSGAERLARDQMRAADLAALSARRAGRSPRQTLLQRLESGFASGTGGSAMGSGDIPRPLGDEMAPAATADLLEALQQMLAEPPTAPSVDRTLRRSLRDDESLLDE